jgi:hypothetical protein
LGGEIAPLPCAAFGLLLGARLPLGILYLALLLTEEIKITLGNRGSLSNNVSHISDA